MKRHENKNELELQRRIDEQEQAMSALLLRVMERPLMPLHQTLGELRTQLTTSQQATIKATQSVEVGVSDLLESQGKLLKRELGQVTGGLRGIQDGLSGFSSALDTHNAAQAERDERIGSSLTKAEGMLTQLDVKTEAAGEVLADTTRTLNRIDGAVSAVRAEQGMATEMLSQEMDSVREQQRTATDRLSEALNGLGQHLEQQHAELDGDLGKTAASLEQLQGQAVSTRDALTVAVQAVTAVDAAIAALRDQEHTARSELSRHLASLARQLGQQQVGLSEHIKGVQQGIAPRLDQLAASISTSSTDITRQYETLSRDQQALVTAAVQEQLAHQLAPFQARTTWLMALCGLSFMSTLGLLAVQLLH